MALGEYCQRPDQHANYSLGKILFHLEAKEAPRTPESCEIGFVCMLSEWLPAPWWKRLQWSTLWSRCNENEGGFDTTICSDTRQKVGHPIVGRLPRGAAKVSARYSADMSGGGLRQVFDHRLSGWNDGRKVILSSWCNLRSSLAFVQQQTAKDPKVLTDISF